MGSGETHGKGSFAGGSRGSHNSPGGAERRRRRERKEPIDPPRSVSFHVSFRIAKTSIICSSVTRLGAAVTWVLRAAHGVIPSPPPTPSSSLSCCPTEHSFTPNSGTQTAHPTHALLLPVVAHKAPVFLNKPTPNTTQDVPPQLQPGSIASR